MFYSVFYYVHVIYVLCFIMYLGLFLDVVIFTSIHACWCGLGWNLVQVPLQSTSTHVD